LTTQNHCRSFTVYLKHSVRGQGKKVLGTRPTDFALRLCYVFQDDDSLRGPHPWWCQPDG